MRDPFVVTGCLWKMKSEFSEQFPQYNHAVVQVPSAEPAVSPGRGNASLLPKYPMGPGEACVFPAQIPSRGGPRSHTGSTGPGWGTQTISKQQPQTAAPWPTAHSGPSLADAHPCAKHVQGGVGAGEHMQLSRKQKHCTLTLKLQ